ncbi:MAG: hypothetical protein Q4G28_09450 [Neisseria sp.]|nr:hypothetical protein [Neisseria sp.]
MPDFPQINGTTASTWGYWDGFIGNNSAAVVLFQTPETLGHERVVARLTVEGIYARGFTGSGINVGLLGLPNGDSQPRIPNDVTKQYVPHNVDLIGNVIEDCYVNGIQSSRFVELREISNIVRRMGHPDWSLDHGVSDYAIDPGYGSATSRFSPQIRRHIIDCSFIDCTRKGIDAHHGTDTIVSGCYIKAGQFGMQVAFEENQTDRSEESSFGLDLGRYVVENCEIHASRVALSFINGALSSLTNRNLDGTRAWAMRIDVQVDRVLLCAPYGWLDNYGRGGMSLNNVTCVFDAPYGLRTATNSSMLRAFWVGSGNITRQGISSDYTLNNCRVMNSTAGNYATGFFVESIGIMNMWNCVVDVTPYSYDKLRRGVAAFTTLNTKLVRAGYTTAPFNITKDPKVASVLGCGAFNQLTDKYTEFTYSVPGGNATDSVNGGDRPTPNTVPIPSSAQQSIVFNFAGITEINIFDTLKKAPMELMATSYAVSSAVLVQTALQPRTVEARLVSAGARAGVRPVVQGVWADSAIGATTLIIPVKVDSFGGATLGYLVSAQREDGSQGAGALFMNDVGTDIEGKKAFTFNRTAGVSVNGKAITASSQFPKGEWMIVAVTMPLTGRDISFLGRYDGNGVTAGFVGQGLAIYPNQSLDSATILARVNELKALYNIT